MNNKGTCIVLTSDEPWGAVWHTQLHYAWQLSLRYKVLYVDPPGSWKFSNLFSAGRHVRTVSNTLKIVPYHNVLPAFLGIPAMYINDWFTSLRIRKILRQWSNTPVSHVWHFDRYRGFFLYRHVPEVKHVYHVVDPYFGEKNDRLFAESSDLIILTSPKQLNNYLAINPHTIYIPQGVDLEFYKSNPKNSSSGHAGTVNDSILLLGTLTSDLDFDILRKIAKKFPGKLLLIGPDQITNPEAKVKFKKLLDEDHVQWLGPMQPADFLSYLKECKVGIIVYEFDKTGKSVLRSPLKVINYLASGKGVITNIDCEIPELLQKAIYKADAPDQFMNLLDEAMGNRLPFDEQLVHRYLKKVSYDQLLQSIYQNLGQNLPDKIDA